MYRTLGTQYQNTIHYTSAGNIVLITCYFVVKSGNFTCNNVTSELAGGIQRLLRANVHVLYECISYIYTIKYNCVYIYITENNATFNRNVFLLSASNFTCGEWQAGVCGSILLELISKSATPIRDTIIVRKKIVPRELWSLVTVRYIFWCYLHGRSVHMLLSNTGTLSKQRNIVYPCNAVWVLVILALLSLLKAIVTLRACGLQWSPL